MQSAFTQISLLHVSTSIYLVYLVYSDFFIIILLLEIENVLNKQLEPTGHTYKSGVKSKPDTHFIMQFFYVTQNTLGMGT